MGTRLSRLVDREIRLLLVTGKRITVTAKEVEHAFFCAECLIFWGVSFCLVTFLFPVAPGVEITWEIKITGFAMFFAMIPASYFLQLILLSLLTQRFPKLHVFEPAILFVTVFLIELVDNKISPILFGVQWGLWVQSASFMRQLVGDFIFMVGYDVLFCCFVLPWIHPFSQAIRPTAHASSLHLHTEGHSSTMAERVAADPVAKSEKLKLPERSFTAKTTPDIQSSNIVEIDGKATPIPSILAVEAEEHYVRVWTEEREIYARHSFGNLIAQLGETGGFSPRRGVWLSFRNIKTFQRDDSGKYVIQPYKGPATVVPKAKAREVRELIKQRPSFGAAQVAEMPNLKAAAS